MLSLRTSLINKGVSPGYAPQRNEAKIDVGHNTIGDIVSIEIETDHGQAGLGLSDFKNEWYLMDHEAQLMNELAEVVVTDNNKEELQTLIKAVLKENEIDPNSFFLVRVITRTSSNV